MKEIIFVIDPMCSWCWGFHPILKTLRENYSNAYKFSLVTGGLRTKGEMQWNQTNRDYLAKNWDAVKKQTQQPFSFSLLQKNSFDYDTYPACKAIITVRELWGEATAFNYLEKIQEAFYTKSIEITELTVLVSYIEKEKQALFRAFYESERAEILMKHDFSKARSMGANSFPSVVKIDTDGHMVCLSGYQTIQEILK